MDKQIQKAKEYENKKTEKITKMKFLKNDKTMYFLNQDLIDKNTKLLGLKGYTTNLDLPNDEIISYYHNLFKVDKKPYTPLFYVFGYFSVSRVEDEVFHKRDCASNKGYNGHTNEGENHRKCDKS